MDDSHNELFTPVNLPLAMTDFISIALITADLFNHTGVIKTRNCVYCCRPIPWVTLTCFKLDNAFFIVGIMTHHLHAYNPFQHDQISNSF